MAKLNIETNLADPDAFYKKLIDLHQGRSDEESRSIDAKLVLLLANHIGDDTVLDEAMTIAGGAASQNG